MIPRLFHIFRNTPAGRETLLNSVYFCKQTGAVPVVYIPEHTKFLMYFENEVVQVDLDQSYLTSPETAKDHATEILLINGFEPTFLGPKHFTASTLPDIPTDFDFMCCPRSITDLSSKIGMGYIGPRVRNIVNAARFPVLLSCTGFKPWKSIVVFFGGSSNAVNALKLGYRLKRKSGLPLDMFTQAEKAPQVYREQIKNQQLEEDVNKMVRDWKILESGLLEENLYEISHEALVVLGAFGHGLIKNLVFGSKSEKIQSTLPNNLLIVGPKYSAVR